MRDTGTLQSLTPVAPPTARRRIRYIVPGVKPGTVIGRDLWEAVIRDHEKVFWRARPQNPITQWYQSQCHGMVRADGWMVYWRGVAHTEIPKLIEQALALPPDFET